MTPARITWRGLSVQHKAALGFAAALVFLGAVGAITHRTMNRFVETTSEVARGHVVLRRLDAMFALIVDAESAVRGYVIAGDRSYLAPYVSARATSAQRVGEIGRLTRDDPEQQKRVELLSQLVRQRLELIERNMDARQQGGLEEARAMVLTGEGKNITESIRRVIDGMSRAETELLEFRMAQERELAWRVRVIIALGLIGAFALGLSATVTVRRDIAERTRAEAEMRHAKDLAEKASRTKSDFLAHMSHELRTPLNSVIGFSGVLLRKKAGSLNEQDRSYLERIQSNGKHLLALINDVLDLSRIEAGHLELERLRFSLDTLVRESVASFEAQARSSDVALRTELPERPVEIDTDPMRLKQVLLNVIGNAVKFTKQGSVTVRLEADRETGAPVRIDVIDTGPGIPEDRQEAVFRTFEQVDSSIARRYGGTGLGLAISRSLCEMMGFRLDLASESGVGSTFSVVFDGASPRRPHVPAVIPASGSVEAPEGATAIASPGSEDLVGARAGGYTVLVVDDDLDARLLMSRLVEEFGCNVTAAQSADEGLRVARTMRPDLILLDLLMSGTSGWDMMKSLRSDPVLAQTPVVVVSVVAHENRGRVLGAVELLDKPVVRDDLFAALRRNLVPARGRVLIVDDEPDSRRLIATYLRDMGQLDIRSAATGREALAALERELPDLIVLDLVMPEMDGVELLDVLRRDPRFLGVPVVIVTARELDSSEQAQLRAAADALLRKGSSLEEELRRALRAILAPAAASPPGDRGTA